MLMENYDLFLNLNIGTIFTIIIRVFRINKDRTGGTPFGNTMNLHKICFVYLMERKHLRDIVLDCIILKKIF